MQRGARINATNRGDDTPLHLGAAHGHREIVHMVSLICSLINFSGGVGLNQRSQFVKGRLLLAPHLLVVQVSARA